MKGRAFQMNAINLKTIVNNFKKILYFSTVFYSKLMGFVLQATLSSKDAMTLIWRRSMRSPPLHNKIGIKKQWKSIKSFRNYSKWIFTIWDLMPSNLTIIDTNEQCDLLEALRVSSCLRGTSGSRRKRNLTNVFTSNLLHAVNRYKTLGTLT
jgi:hypothetical protein